MVQQEWGRSHAKGAEGAEGAEGKGRPPIEEDWGRCFCCSKEREGSHGDTGSAEGKGGGCLMFNFGFWMKNDRAERRERLEAVMVNVE